MEALTPVNLDSTGADRPPDSAHLDTPPPRWLWVATLAVIVPILAPLSYLIYSVVLGPDWDLLSSRRTLELVLNTVLLTATVATAATIVGVGAAWVVTRTDIRFARIWTTLLALPLVVPSYVGALVLVAATGPSGILSQIVAVDRLEGFWGAWISLTLFTYPYVFLVATVTLRRIDPSLEEAARGLGSNAWTAFRTITLPQLRPAIGGSVLLVALYTMSDFGAVSLMRYNTLTRAIYTQWSTRIDRAPALTLAALLMGLTAVVLWMESRTRGRGVYFAAKPSRTTHRVHLSGRSAAFSLATLSTVVTLALVIPISVLIAWVGRGITNGITFGDVGAPAFRSLSVSVAAALVAAAVAIPIAMLAVRYPSRWASRAERSVWAVYALPHVTVGVAMVFFTITFLPFAYQTLFILIGVYVAIFLPQASSAAQTALRQVDPRTEEASRGLGKSSLVTTFRITVPLISRGLISGGTLVFLTVMKELPVTLLLRPTGFDTLALNIWQQTSEGFYARASAASLVLLVISSVPMYFLATRDLRHA